MLTGPQIRRARTMLGWGRTTFSRNAHITEALVTAAESSDGPAWLTDEQEASIRRALELAGVEFTADGLRLRQDQP